MSESEISNIKIYDILKKIPHRYPFILVDKITSVLPGKSITAIKNVSCNEPCFQGHFPEFPVMPGVLILESLAQSCALLFVYSYENKAMPNYKAPEGGVFLFAGIDNVRFKKVVEPGDQLILKSELVRYKKELAKFKTTAYVNDQVVCTADMLSAYRKMAPVSTLLPDTHYRGNCISSS